jgi:hypothetical protein
MVILMRLRPLLVLAALAWVGCFNVEEPPCTFACGDNGQCPDDYQCMPDGYCHLHGTGICTFPDAAMGPDLAGMMSLGDGGGDQSPAEADLSMPVESDMSMPVPSPSPSSSPAPSPSSTPTPSPSSTPVPTPSPTPTPTPTPSPTPTPITSVGPATAVTVGPSPSPSPVSLAITPSPAPSVAAPSGLLVTEYVSPPGATFDATLTYNDGSDHSLPMSYAGTVGNQDLFTCTIPAEPSSTTVTFFITVRDGALNATVDPASSQSYTYQSQ